MATRGNYDAQQFDIAEDSSADRGYSSSSSARNLGLIILGNSGVGKSFLANILLGREAFVHRIAAKAVTTQTEFEEITMGAETYAIFNIPGLIEADQQRIDINKHEIGKAFSQRPTSLILYVFGQQNGRIRDEDVVAFNALNEAYPFDPKSLVIVVNGLAKDRPHDYEGEVIVLLEELIKVSCRNMCVLDMINKTDAYEQQNLKNKLLQVIVERTPRVHFKKQEIEIKSGDVRRAKEQIKALQAEFQRNKQMYEEKIKEQQTKYQEMFTQIRNENEHMRRFIEKQAQEANRIIKEVREKEAAYRKEQEQRNGELVKKMEQMQKTHEKAIKEVKERAVQQKAMEEAPRAKTLQTTASNNTPTAIPKKAEYCYGNTCSQCGKCRDWHYDGNFTRDYQRWMRDDCRDLRDTKRWQRRPGATCDLFETNVVDRLVDNLRSNNSLLAVSDRDRDTIVRATTGRDEMRKLVTTTHGRSAVARYGIVTDPATTPLTIRKSGTSRFAKAPPTTGTTRTIRIHGICCCD